MSALKIALSLVWEYIKTSVWFIPVFISFLYALLAFVLLSIDKDKADWIISLLPSLPINIEGVRQIFSVTTGSMMTIVGVTFSVSVVSLSLASNQFGPKILRNYLRDTSNKIVLGVLVGTFVYGLVVLVFIDGHEESRHVVVSVTFANFILSILGMIGLIYFIHNISASIQADHVIAMIGKDLNDAINNNLLFEGEAESAEVQNCKNIFNTPHKKHIVTNISGYVQSIDYERICDLASKNNCYIDLETRSGKFVVAGSEVGDYYYTDEDESIYKQIQACITVGTMRTPIQDMEFAIDQLVQVGLRALSPGINDSITAITCVHWLSASLAKMTLGKFPSYCMKDQNDQIRVTANEFTFEGAVESVFIPFRQNSCGNQMVQICLLESILSIMKVTNDKQYIKTLLLHASLIYKAAKESDYQEIDFDIIKSRFVLCEKNMQEKTA